MEAVTIAGLAVVAICGYFTVLDFMGDIGLAGKKQRHASDESFSAENRVCSHQSRIKKMAGMHI